MLQAWADFVGGGWELGRVHKDGRATLSKPGPPPAHPREGVPLKGLGLVAVPAGEAGVERGEEMGGPEGGPERAPHGVGIAMRLEPVQGPQQGVQALQEGLEPGRAVVGGGPQAALPEAGSQGPQPVRQRRFQRLAPNTRQRAYCLLRQHRRDGRGVDVGEGMRRGWAAWAE